MSSSVKELKTFPKGGIHPPGRKQLSNFREIKNAVIPSLSIIPLSQHIGSPAECLVKPGDEVYEEMLIGKSTGFISANIHSPVPGIVKSIDEIYLPNGLKTKAVVIELQGEFNRLGKKHSEHDWNQRNGEDLLKAITEKGIVGLGGATFPTHVKFTIPRQKKVDYFIVNGVECEPYLTSDYRLMLEKPSAILEGIKITARILEPKKIFIGIENNKPDAVQLMKETVQNSGLDITVVPLKIKYPQGDEKQLLKAVLNKEVPSGGLPIDIGAVVSNVGTLFAIYEAIVLEKPLIERIVTVSGGGVVSPGNYKVRIGTSVGSLLEECGGLSDKTEKIVMGGPMMGFAVCDPDAPVIKGTSGILALTAQETKRAARTACIQCGRCIQACPMGLHPTRLFKQIDHQEYQSAIDLGLMDCKECGSCAYICPAHIPLVQGMKLGKRMAKKVKK